MKLNIYACLAWCFIHVAAGLRAQDKIYFDANGKASAEASAFYYRTCTGTDCKSYYLSGKPYFEGSIEKADPADESRNQYSGTCTWFFKNGKKWKVRNFAADGKEEGMSAYYFESGKPARVEHYEKGILKNGLYEEYDENGTVNKVFREAFDDNRHDWDLYSSNKSNCRIAQGTMELQALTRAGTSRFTSIPCEKNKFSFEMEFIKPDFSMPKQGILFGFKDWQNYWYFTFRRDYFSVGQIVEGVTTTKGHDLYCTILSKLPSAVKLKVISTGDKLDFFVNGEMKYTCTFASLPGRNFGLVLGGKGKAQVDNFVFKELDVPASWGERPSANGTTNDSDKWEGSGSGFFIHESGLLATNYHVIDQMKEIQINYTEDEKPKKAWAKVVVSDKDNDVSILKIEDASFKPLAPLKYSFKTGAATNPGASVFSIGYPMFNVLGVEPKFSDGKISSKTGFKNAINSFQTTVPVQPGNSGSPLFNDKGEVIGIVNAIIQDADNVSYAIKVSYLINLFDLLTVPVSPPSVPLAPTLSLEEKIKLLSPYVALIKVR